MSRLLLTATVALVLTAGASAQCQYWSPWYPAYPVSPAVFWGTPAPKPLPPAPKPFVPKSGVGVREEEEPAPFKPKESVKPKNGEPKEKEPPRIPKVKLPGLPDDPDEPKPAPKKVVPKKEPLADKGKTVEQFIIPADGNAATPGPEVKVGFFNHSDRDITLEVNGEQLRLPSEQYVTLRLKRTFTWAEKGQKATDVAVPPDADGIEIVFRK